MTSKNTKTDRYSNVPKEMELVSKIAKQLSTEGVDLNPCQRREIVNFVRARTHYLELQNGRLDKRKVEKDLQFRVSTLRRISEQLVRDGNPYDFAGDEFIERQLFLTILERAFLIQEKKVKSNLRDALGLDFHLWSLNQILIEGGVAKPTHVLTDLLGKAGYWKGFGTSLKAVTVQNKISRAKKLIDLAIKKKACHMPLIISEWPRWHSEDFVLKLSQGCPKCANIWLGVLGDIKPEVNPWSFAVLDLRKSLPYFSEAIGLVDESLRAGGEVGMSLPKLLGYLPRRYQGAILHLFESKLFV